MLQILVPVLQQQHETTQTLYSRPDHFCLHILQNKGKSQPTYRIVTVCFEVNVLEEVENFADINTVTPVRT